MTTRSVGVKVAATAGLLVLLASARRLSAPSMGLSARVHDDSGRRRSASASSNAHLDASSSSSAAYVASSSAAPGGGTRTSFSTRGTALSNRDVISLWRGAAPSAETFRETFLSSLRASPHDAFYWETPPLTRRALEREYEHVVTRAPSLVGASPEPETFAEHLASAEAEAAPRARTSRRSSAPRPPRARTRSSSRSGRRSTRASGSGTGSGGSTTRTTTTTTRCGCPRTAAAWRGRTCGWTRRRSITSTRRIERDRGDVRDSRATTRRVVNAVRCV